MRLPSAPVSIMAAAILLAVALIGLLAHEGIARANGREVVLQINGYDPRGLLTGHYVRFQFTSDLPLGAPCPPGAGDRWRRSSWLALTRAGGHHIVRGAGQTRGEAQRLGEIVVRGDMDCWPGRERRWIMLKLGIDRLHVDQAQAEAIQKHLAAQPGSDPEAYAVVSVGADGKARLKGVIVGGQRTELEWF